MTGKSDFAPNENAFSIPLNYQNVSMKMKRIIASKKWLITYLVLSSILVCLDIAGIVICIWAGVESNTALLSVGAVLLVYLLPATGIVLVCLNRRACLYWVEDGCLKRRGLLCGYTDCIQCEEVHSVWVTYDGKRVFILIYRPSKRSHSASTIEFDNSEESREILKSFWNGTVNDLSSV